MERKSDALREHWSALDEEVLRTMRSASAISQVSRPARITARPAKRQTAHFSERISRCRTTSTALT